jgi:hypothetical protein
MGMNARDYQKKGSGKKSGFQSRLKSSTACRLLQVKPSGAVKMFDS